MVQKCVHSADLMELITALYFHLHTPYGLRDINVCKIFGWDTTLTKHYSECGRVVREALPTFKYKWMPLRNSRLGQVHDQKVTYRTGWPRDGDNQTDSMHTFSYVEHTAKPAHIPEMCLNVQ